MEFFNALPHRAAARCSSLPSTARQGRRPISLHVGAAIEHVYVVPDAIRHPDACREGAIASVERRWVGTAVATKQHVKVAVAVY